MYIYVYINISYHIQIIKYFTSSSSAPPAPPLAPPPAPPPPPFPWAGKAQEATTAADVSLYVCLHVSLYVCLFVSLSVCLDVSISAVGAALLGCT